MGVPIIETQGITS